MPWMPNFGLSLWCEATDPAKSEAAQADNSLRRFLVCYVLEDPPTRKIKDSQIALAEETFINVDSSETQMTVRFEPNSEKRLAGISLRLEARSVQGAVELTYPVATLQMSFWSAIMGIPIGIYGMLGVDEKHGVKYEVRPQRVAAESFWLPAGIALDDEWKVILGLYREGKSSSSPYTQFMMFFKIIEGFYERKTRLVGKLKALFKERGKKFVEPATRITKDMLVYAIAPAEFSERWEGKSFGEFYKYLDRTHRRRIAHTFPKDAEPLNPDSFADYQQTVTLANLLDQMSRKLIEGCLRQLVVPNQSGG